MLYTSYEFKGLKDGEVYVGLDHYNMYTSNNDLGFTFYYMSIDL